MKKKGEKYKVIEAIVLLEKPRGLIKVLLLANSIDSAILDLQEEYPTRQITRQSIMSWKFLTVAEYNAYEEEKQGGKLFNSEQEVKVCDASKAEQGTNVDNQKNNHE